MSNVQEAIREYLIEIENRTTLALRNIAELLARSGQPFDDRIKNHIATRANTWIEQTIDFVAIENAINKKTEKSHRAT